MINLIVPKAYLDQRDQIIAKDDFRQMGLLLWCDSAPKDWLERVQECGYKALVSPCHDKDVLDMPGEDGRMIAKKPHYHVDIYFPGKKTGDQCQHIADYISDQPGYEVFYIVDREVHARYLCHLDSPKKHRYPVTEVLGFNGASYEKYVGSIAENQYNLELLGDILDWICNNNILYYSDLVDYAREHKLNQWVSALMKNLTPIVKSYLQSRNFKVMDKEKKNNLQLQNRYFSNKAAASELEYKQLKDQEERL